MVPVSASWPVLLSRLRVNWVQSETAAFRHLVQRIPAALGTAQTGFRTDPAVVMQFGMLLALLAASPACCFASLHDLLKNLDVGPGPTRRHCAGRHADTGAVQTKADALPHLGHRVLRQTSILQDVQVCAQL